MKLETFFEIFLLGDHSMINGVFKGNFGGWNGQLMDELMIINFLFTACLHSLSVSCLMAYEP